MNIALDYDGTYTSDPEFWEWFVRKAQSRGFSVYVVTMRYATEPVSETLRAMVAGVIYTGRQAKLRYVERVMEIDMDIWIDDHPPYLFEDAL